MTEITIKTEIDHDWTLAEMQGDERHRLEMYCDIEDRTIEIYDRLTDDRSWTAREHHGHALAYTIRPQACADLRGLLGTVCPLLAQLAELHSSEWDGSNHVARWSDAERAMQLRAQLEEAVHDHRPDSTEGELHDAADWLEAEPPAVNADTTDEALETLAERIQDAAHGDGAHLAGLDEYLQHRRAGAGE